MRQLLTAAVMAAAPLAAMVACLSAARALPRRLGRPWLLLGVSSAVAATGVVLLNLSGTIGSEPLYAWFEVAALGLFAGGLGWILLLRDRQRLLEVCLDASIIVAAVTVATFSWSPGAALLGQAGVENVSVVGIFGAPITAACAVLFALVLLLVRGRASGFAPAMLAAAALLLALSSVPLARGDGACCTSLGATGAAFSLGWASLAVTAVYAARYGTRAFHFSRADAGAIRLRLVVAPAVAAIMGAVAVDTAWRGALAQNAAIALAVLGTVLALRVTQLFAATQSLTAARAELHQSRALIELSQALSRTSKLQETLDLITEWAVTLLDGKGAAIVLASDDGQVLEFKSINGLPEELLRLSLPTDGSFAGWIVRHGRARATADPRTEPYMHASGLRYIGQSPVAGAPLCYRGRTLGALLCAGHDPFDDGRLELLGALADQAAIAIENARLFGEVHRLSLTDPLTGLPNRRQLEHDLKREFAAAKRGRRLVAIMFDLNGFKQYNDRYGHLAGDEALRQFAAALAAETRTMNMAARYGGDEFIALLADNDTAGATVFLDRVRARFPGPQAAARDHELSVAAGMAQFDAQMRTPQELIAAADAALYQEKLRRPDARQRSAS